jgi:uncharacterized low-complexity protein
MMKKIIYLLFISLLLSYAATKGADGKPGENGKPGKNNSKGEDGKNGEDGRDNTKTIHIK